MAFPYRKHGATWSPVGKIVGSFPFANVGDFGADCPTIARVDPHRLEATAVHTPIPARWMISGCVLVGASGTPGALNPTI